MKTPIHFLIITLSYKAFLTLTLKESLNNFSEFLGFVALILSLNLIRSLQANIVKNSSVYCLMYSVRFLFENMKKILHLLVLQCICSGAKSQRRTNYLKLRDVCSDDMSLNNNKITS